MANPLLAFQIIGAVATGLSARSQAMNQAAQQESAALLAETQALQRDTIAREDLARFLSTTRAARAANGLSSNSPNAFILEKEAILASDKDRLRQRADDRQKASNFRAAAASSRQIGGLSLVTGVAKAGISIAQAGQN